MEMKKYQFGYGCMRLPVTNADDPASFDYPLIEKLFDTYMDQGFTYFDAAYTYHGYHCEEAVKKALVERHPRDSFELATKLPLRDFKDAEDMSASSMNSWSTAGWTTLTIICSTTWALMSMINVRNIMRLVLPLRRKRKGK